jgi:hypothetical protein
MHLLVGFGICSIQPLGPPTRDIILRPHTVDLFYLMKGKSSIYRAMAVLKELFTAPDFPIAMPGLYPIFWRSAYPRLLSPIASLRPSSRLSASSNLCGLFCCLLSSAMAFFFF